MVILCWPFTTTVVVVVVVVVLLVVVGGMGAKVMMGTVEGCGEGDDVNGLPEK